VHGQPKLDRWPAAGTDAALAAGSGEPRSWRPISQSVMHSVFQRYSALRQQGVQVELHVSFIEIYQVCVLAPVCKGGGNGARVVCV
jgi:hypothetical protein